MTYWTWNTAQDEFRIEQIGPRRMNLFFGKSVIGSYPTPQEAADCCGKGHHAQIPEGFDGASLGVSRSLTDWRQTLATSTELQDDTVGVLAELRLLSFRVDRPHGAPHQPRN
jgi:hypothetical protein